MPVQPSYCKFLGKYINFITLILPCSILRWNPFLFCIKIHQENVNVFNISKAITIDVNMKYEKTIH
jgi:hypothetical protein